MSYDYDLFVIGGGSGGVRSANRTAMSGKRVGLAEESRYGGTCVIRGCIPKKLYVYASTFHEQFEDAAGFGWNVGETSFDWSKLVSNKEAEISRLEDIYKNGLAGNGVDTFDSRAELTGKNEIFLTAENKKVTAEKIVIAVGGAPNVDSTLEGHELGIVSDAAFDLDTLPESIIIVGAGYIAVEFAGIFNGLGVDTTLVYRGEEILRGFDNDIRKLLHEEYENRGVKIVTEQVITKLEAAEGDKKRATFSGGDVIETDQVMFAMGRVPVTQTLGLEHAGVETDSRGYIKVDQYSRTNVDNIWALGDVTNRVSLTPVAIHEAMCFVATEFQNNPQKPDHAMIPTAVFSHPEIGTVGMSEEDAGEAFEKLDVYRAIFRPLKNTLSGRNSKMLMKLIVDAKSEKVVGAHILGPDAGEMAQLLAIPMKMGARKKDFDATMALHPSAAEELVTMYESSYSVIKGKRVGENS